MILEVYLQPSFSLTRESMGIEEYEDYNSDAILFQQGYDANVLEVEAGNEFEIPEDYEASIISDDIPFEVIDREYDLTEDVYNASLEPGVYEFSEEDHKVRLIRNGYSRYSAFDDI